MRKAGTASSRCVVWLGVVCLAIGAWLLGTAGAPQAAETFESAAVQILPPRLFQGTSRKVVVRSVTFQSPVAGVATLQLTNGAKIDPRSDDIVASARIAFNGTVVVKPAEFLPFRNVIDVPVSLVQGKNTLAVTLIKPLGSKLSAEILAPATGIALTPIANPVVIGGAPLTATATVTALGLPVPGAEVEFSVTGLGGVPLQSQMTDGAGMAVVTIAGLTKAGPAQLVAKVVDAGPALSAQQPFTVIKQAQVMISDGRESAGLSLGETLPLLMDVDYSGGAGVQTVILDEPVVTPNTGGLKVYTDRREGGWSTADPTTFVVGVTLAAGGEPKDAGGYTVTFRARVAETGAEWVETLPVTVVDPAVSTLAIAAPQPVPAAIPLKTTAVVNFSASISGSGARPASLTLYEAGKPEPVGALRDDGVGGDFVAGDLFYSGEFPIAAGSKEGAKVFFAEAVDKGQRIVSPPASLTLTALPIGPADDADYPPVVSDGGAVFASDQLLVKFEPNVSLDRIKQIIAEQKGRIIGTLPGIEVYQIEVPAGGDANAVEVAVVDLEKYAEVKFAEPNAVFSLLKRTTVDPCTPATDEKQWTFTQVRGDQSTYVATGAGQTVAVIDGGVYEHSPELTGRVEGDESLDVHATMVAGIIGAARNGQGIAGTAPRATIRSVAFASILPANETSLATVITNAYTGSTQLNVVNLSIGNAGGGGANDPCNELTGSETDKASSMLAHYDANNTNNNSKLFVVAAGNTPGTRVNVLCRPDGQSGNAPANVLCVGGTNRSEGAWLCTPSNTTANPNRIDIVAPAGTTGYLGSSTDDDVCSTTNTANSYSRYSGTSFAAPHVAGAAAALWGRDGLNTAEKVKARLLRSARTLGTFGPAPAPSGVVYANVGRLDVFEAVFNGSFEHTDTDNNLPGWSFINSPTSGPCDRRDAKGTVTAADGSAFVECTTGPNPKATSQSGADPAAAALYKYFQITRPNPNPNPNPVYLSFRYNVISEEYPEFTFTKSRYKDRIRIVLEACTDDAGAGCVDIPSDTQAIPPFTNPLVDATIIELDRGSNGGCFRCVDTGAEGQSGVFRDYNGGDTSTGQTDWFTRSTVIPALPSGTSWYRLKAEVMDDGDNVYDSAVLLDDIQLVNRGDTQSSTCTGQAIPPDAQVSVAERDRQLCCDYSTAEQGSDLGFFCTNHPLEFDLISAATPTPLLQKAAPAAAFPADAARRLMRQ